MVTNAVSGTAQAAETTVPIVAAITAAAAEQAAAAAASTAAIVAGLQEIAVIDAANFAKPSVLGTTFSAGGIVPAAAGGWSLPSSFGTDRVIAALTPGEMVLPTGLADRVRGMTDQGGGGDTHVHPTVVINGPADAAQIARMFRDNHGHIADALKRSLRSNGLTPRTI